MKVFNPGLRPPSGYVYTSPAGVLFEANSIEQLVERVTLFRKRTKLPVGDPVKEINAQLCERHPRMCRELLDPRILASRVVNAAVDWTTAEKAPQPVCDTERQRRVSICLACPYRGKWEAQCGPCSEKLAKLLPAALRGTPPAAPLTGQACTEAGDDLSVAVNFTQPTLSTVPEACWRRAK